MSQIEKLRELLKPPIGRRSKESKLTLLVRTFGYGTFRQAFVQKAMKDYPDRAKWRLCEPWISELLALGPAPPPELTWTLRLPLGRQIEDECDFKRRKLAELSALFDRFYDLRSIWDEIRIGEVVTVAVAYYAGRMTVSKLALERGNCSVSTISMLLRDARKLIGIRTSSSRR